MSTSYLCQKFCISTQIQNSLLMPICYLLDVTTLWIPHLTIIASISYYTLSCFPFQDLSYLFINGSLCYSAFSCFPCHYSSLQCLSELLSLSHIYSCCSVWCCLLQHVSNQSLSMYTWSIVLLIKLNTSFSVFSSTIYVYLELIVPTGFHMKAPKYADRFEEVNK